MIAFPGGLINDLTYSISRIKKSHLESSYTSRIELPEHHVDYKSHNRRRRRRFAGSSSKTRLRHSQLAILSWLGPSYHYGSWIMQMPSHVYCALRTAWSTHYS